MDIVHISSIRLSWAWAVKNLRKPALTIWFDQVSMNTMFDVVDNVFRRGISARILRFGSTGSCVQVEPLWYVSDLCWKRFCNATIATAGAESGWICYPTVLTWFYVEIYTCNHANCNCFLNQSKKLQLVSCASSCHTCVPCVVWVCCSKPGMLIKIQHLCWRPTCCTTNIVQSTRWCVHGLNCRKPDVRFLLQALNRKNQSAAFPRRIHAWMSSCLVLAVLCIER